MKCCDVFGKPKEYYFVTGTTKEWLNKELGVLKRKKNQTLRMPKETLDEIRRSHRVL